MVLRVVKKGLGVPVLSVHCFWRMSAASSERLGGSESVRDG